MIARSALPALFLVVTAPLAAAGCQDPPGPAPLWSKDPHGDNLFPDARLQGATGALEMTPDLFRRYLPKGVDTTNTDTLL